MFPKHNAIRLRYRRTSVPSCVLREQPAAQYVVRRLRRDVIEHAVALADTKVCAGQELTLGGSGRYRR